MFFLQTGINEDFFISKGGDKTTQRDNARYGGCILHSGNIEYKYKLRFSFSPILYAGFHSNLYNTSIYQH
jgi:hypothetical protein